MHNSLKKINYILFKPLDSSVLYDWSEYLKKQNIEEEVLDKLIDLFIDGTIQYNALEGIKQIVYYAKRIEFPEFLGTFILNHTNGDVTYNKYKYTNSEFIQLVYPQKMKYIEMTKESKDIHAIELFSEFKSRIEKIDSLSTEFSSEKTKAKFESLKKIIG